MAAFPCPYCGHALVASDEGEAKLERCPSCAGTLLIAYRYRLVARVGSISAGELYEGIDDGFSQRVAILFVAEPGDAAAVQRFVAGNELFANLGGRGIIKLHEVGSRSDRRAYVVMEWLEGETLDVLVGRAGALDQATLLELVDELLTGLSKAHRAMPATVHGHIHPGKIGFRSNAKPVLFGFEWATQSNSQDSQLADSLISASEPAETRRRSTDLRQLALCIYYAATGEWLADQELTAQRHQAAAKLPGPLGRLVDRMLGAGLDGYESAVEAATDFERLMRGRDRWVSKAPRVRDRSEEQMGTAWTPGARVEAEHYTEDQDHYDGDANYGDVDDDDDDGMEFEPSSFESAPVWPSQQPAVSPNAAAADWAARVAQRQAEAQAAAASKKNHTGQIGVAVAVTLALGSFVVAMVEGDSDDMASATAPRTFEPEPIPQPPFAIEPIPQRVPDPESELAGVFRYTGKITGPVDFAGLGLDETCEVWIAPNEGDLNCRWYVDCGQPQRRIYGGGNVGFSTCTVEVGRPLQAQDHQDDAPDGAFVADLEATPPMLIVEDRWMQPPVRVVISLDEGGIHDGPVPEVALAPRPTQAVIEDRINRGDLPEIEAGVLADW